MILDTNGLSALLQANRAFLARFAQVYQWSIPVPVLGEYRFGLLRSRLRSRLETAVDELERTEEILVATSRTARVYAQIREELRIKGKPIPVNDQWIAALAREHGLPVATNDPHFGEVDGLDVRGW